MPEPIDKPDDSADLAAWRTRVKGSNINEASLLATDYLNHFNEVVMLIDMMPDMPECLVDAREWQPKTYQQHFADSAFSDKDLAVEAYDHAPEEYRRPLEETVDSINRLVAASLDRIEAATAADSTRTVEETAQRASRDLQRLVEIASGIINGAKPTIHQNEIDEMFHG